MINGLRSIIEAARDEADGSLKDYTVLSTRVDPYRLDTPANHRVGKWFADQIDRLKLLHRRLHLRGIHYALLGSTTLLSGEPYTNTAENWDWLQSQAAKAARWLGYVPFDAITDARNEAPIIRVREPLSPDGVWSNISTSVYIERPYLGSIRPRAALIGFQREQPCKFAFFAEKKSLDEILEPIADFYSADLYLPTGEISDTQIHLMAKAGADDGRKLIVFTLTDFDPAGWQMAVSIGRKLQAFKDLQFPDLEFEVRPIALTGEQARSLDLPSTPLKETERRGNKWREAMGWEQTEIDALSTLRPDVLRRIVEEAVAPFFDHTLGRRIFEARVKWEQRANDQIKEQLDGERLSALQLSAENRISEMRDELDAIETEIASAMEDLRVDVPKPEIPEVAIDHTLQGTPLVSSAWPWPDQTRALKARKSYIDGGGS